ncbi:MAG TPA: hypothetical protein VKN14_07160, partial [Flavobacteriaceae bacterium]|nr:hypothetical protein [Flavobacteriaceae bacterium]
NCGGAVGSIFTVLGENGINLAGYVLYGPATLLVYTRKVYDSYKTSSFLLGHDNEYHLMREDIKCPEKGKIYSVNEGNYNRWDPQIQEWNNYIKKTHSLRYSGALVVDAHRVLMEGGIFAYPPDSKNKHGKLRFLYEVLPFNFIFEKSGGKTAYQAFNTEALPLSLNESNKRAPLVIGSRQEISKYLETIHNQDYT